MRSMMILGACLGLMACTATPVAMAPSDSARVAEVSVRPDVLAITMTDGARCVAKRPDDIRTGWSGITDNCGYALPFSVLFFAGAEDPARFAVEPAAEVVGKDGTLMPRAEVYVTDVDGVQKQFVMRLDNVRIQLVDPV